MNVFDSARIIGGETIFDSSSPRKMRIYKNMGKYAVFVAGKRFVLLSDDKQEYVEKIAKEVNESIVNITAANPLLDSRACAILCALDYADDMYKEILKNQRFADKAKEVMNQSDKHAKTIRDLKEEIQKAKNLNETQLHQIADKNVEIKSLSNQVKEQADEIIKLKEEIAKLQEKQKNEAAQQKPVSFGDKKPFQNPVAKVKTPENPVKKN